MKRRRDGGYEYTTRSTFALPLYPKDPPISADQFRGRPNSRRAWCDCHQVRDFCQKCCDPKKRRLELLKGRHLLMKKATP